MDWDLNIKKVNGMVNNKLDPHYKTKECKTWIGI